MFPETSNRSLEELAFRKHPLLVVVVIIINLRGIFFFLVFEGAKIREEQQKRIEDHIHEEDIPMSPTSMIENDKEAHAYHVEHTKK